MKQIITMPFGNIPSKLNSHKGAWAYLWKRIIEEQTGHPCEVDTNKGTNFFEAGYDKVYVYHGMEFQGSLNLFGGPTKEAAEHIARVFGGSYDIISLDVDMPKYGTMCKSRIYNKAGEINENVPQEWRDLDWDTIDAMTENCTTLKMENLPYKNVTFGDSHSFSAWQPGHKALRHDGRTLRGTLKVGIGSYLPKEIDKLTVYLGNIDVRFHFGRQENPECDIVDKLMKLSEQLEALQNEGRVKEIELVTLLPVEDESRVLPKTGWFLGQPFIGSREQRAEFVSKFNRGLKDLCRVKGWSIFEWPQEWYDAADEDPESFFDKMEKPRSVHLSREFYRWTIPEDLPVKKEKIVKEKKPAKMSIPKTPVVDGTFEELVDKELIKEFGFFLNKVNQKACMEKGWIEGEWEAVDMEGNPCPAMGFDVEYFHPVITMDDRMRYIAEHIVSKDYVSPRNRVCNTIISHFYGARGIHQTLTEVEDPNFAHVDFQRIADGDMEYTRELQEKANRARKNKKPLWGTTELHTSLQTSARNYCREKYNDPDRGAEPLNVAEWVANFITDGTIDKMLASTSIKNTFEILTAKRGIGEYYGYHCATSNSVNPMLKYDNDEEFVRPGPGACMTISRLFPGLDKRRYGDAVIWIRKNQKTLFPDLEFHPNMANIIVDGKPIFEINQNELKCYGTEVACCQFSVFLYLKENPHLAAKRKVARVQDTGVCAGGLSDLFGI